MLRLCTAAVAAVLFTLMTSLALAADKPAADKPAAEKPAGKADGKADGKQVFLDQKCTKCHKVTALGIAAAAEKEKIIDLSGTGADQDVAWFKKFLKKEIEIDSKVKPGEKVKHKQAWKGNDADLDTLAAWLKGLTKK